MSQQKLKDTAIRHAVLLEQLKVGELKNLQSYYRQLDKLIRELLTRQELTRASETGQVSGDLTYYEWLKQQTTTFQDQALGLAKGKLFREGGLFSERFAELQLDRNFRPITLARMKELEPLAFERAGL